MRPARILLLVVALVAGGLAAYLATRGQAPAPVVETVTQVREEAKRQVLVAAMPIGVGQRLGPAVVEWQDWPEGAVRPEYITSDVIPDAVDLMSGTVARFEIFAGEPIRRAKLVRSDQGYLSAVIEPGMRAVSIGVSAVSGAGGFIVPNDRVDIVQTIRGAATQTILSNIKVLAIGQRLGEVGTTAGREPEQDPQSQVFANNTIATLELNPAQAETIIAASSTGQLSLVLRSVQDFDQPDDAVDQQRASTSVRLIRFGTETSIMSGALEPIAAIGEDAPRPEQPDPLAVPDVHLDAPLVLPPQTQTEVN